MLTFDYVFKLKLNKGYQLKKADKLFNLTFWGVFFIVTISFVSTYIYHYNNKSTLDTFLTSASVAGFFGLIGRFLITLVQEYFKRKTYKIAYIAKKSSFSISIGYAIQEFYAKTSDMKLEIFYFENNKDLEEKYIDFLHKKANFYDGLIIRPIKINEEFITAISLLMKEDKEIVLVDSNLNKIQKKALSTNHIPFFVGSDFSHGGKLIAKYINSKIKHYGKNDTKVILLLGPQDQITAKKKGY